MLARDQYVCGICHRSIDRSLKHPHPMCATVDHIRPKAQFPHLMYVESNLRAAHKRCNSLANVQFQGWTRARNQVREW